MFPLSFFGYEMALNATFEDKLNIIKILLVNAAPYSFDDAFTRYLHALDGITVTQSEILFNTFKFIFKSKTEVMIPNL